MRAPSAPSAPSSLFPSSLPCYTDTRWNFAELGSALLLRGQGLAAGLYCPPHGSGLPCLTTKALCNMRPPLWSCASPAARARGPMQHSVTDPGCFLPSLHSACLLPLRTPVHASTAWVERVPPPRAPLVQAVHSQRRALWISLLLVSLPAHRHPAPWSLALPARVRPLWPRGHQPPSARRGAPGSVGRSCWRCRAGRRGRGGLLWKCPLPAASLFHRLLITICFLTSFKLLNTRFPERHNRGCMVFSGKDCVSHCALASGNWPGKGDWSLWATSFHVYTRVFGSSVVLRAYRQTSRSVKCFTLVTFRVITPLPSLLPSFLGSWKPLASIGASAALSEPRGWAPRRPRGRSVAAVAGLRNATEPHHALRRPAALLSLWLSPPRSMVTRCGVGWLQGSGRSTAPGVRRQPCLWPAIGWSVAASPRAPPRPIAGAHAPSAGHLRALAILCDRHWCPFHPRAGQRRGCLPLRPAFTPSGRADFY